MKTRTVVRAALAVLVALATSVAAHGDLHERIEALTKRIAESPRDAGLHLKRGELRRQHREFEAALADFARALALDPQLDTALLLKGRTLEGTGRHAQALKALDAFVARQPDAADGHWWRGQVLSALGRHAEAARAYGRALVRVPRPRPVHYLEHARALQRSGDTAAALASLDKGIAALGSLAALQLFAIEVELDRRGYDAALSRVDQLAAASQRKERWLIKRGEICELARRPQEARRAYRSAQELLDALPARHRKTAATRELAARVREGLERLGPETASREPSSVETKR